ncbi:MAG: glutamate-5-semialdehyde dehydrogenase [Candidatus Atribacteria bacterium]|nr:glutamate-5-semialdehyde dehydrogenase [Candidatus Atribacteria bacterium]
MIEQIREIAQKTKVASRALVNVSTLQKNQFLNHLAEILESDKEEILAENRRDVSRADQSGIKKSLLDRLSLNEKRIREMSQGLQEVASLPDPVGEVINGVKRPNGLIIHRVRVPLGVIAIIYEARPNVTIDSIGLGIKSGNALLLRGSSLALFSNQILVKKAKQALTRSGLPSDSVNLLGSGKHEEVELLLSLRGLIDVVIPRGGGELIQTVVKNSQIPVIETGVGNCHIYLDASANFSMAEKIVINAKTQRPSVCNACETLLVHQAVAADFLPRIGKSLIEKGVEIRGCEKTKALIDDAQVADEEDWYAEYLDLILAVKVVAGIEEAIEHIDRYGSHHSEAIVTEDYQSALRFLQEVDAAAVYVNASTRFTDGGQFGMGAEIGISTQKLHARGPMGIRELTTTKFMVYGLGQIRE